MRKTKSNNYSKRDNDNRPLLLPRMHIFKNYNKPANYSTDMGH